MRLITRCTLWQVLDVVLGPGEAVDIIQGHFQGTGVLRITFSHCCLIPPIIKMATSLIYLSQHQQMMTMVLPQYVANKPNANELVAVVKVAVQTRLCITHFLFLQNWNSLLMDSSKGRNYNLFKSDNKCEMYLSSLTGTSLHTMFKFRTANHKLPIETGRWNNVELSERKCQLCERNHIGDEFHYLLECTFFRNERRRYIDQQFYRSPNVLKFKQLLQTTDTEKLISLSQFMKIIMHAFK